MHICWSKAWIPRVQGSEPVHSEQGREMSRILVHSPSSHVATPAVLVWAAVCRRGHQVAVEVSSKCQHIPVCQTVQQAVQLVPPVCSFLHSAGMRCSGVLVTPNQIKIAVMHLHLDVYKSSWKKHAPSDVLCFAESFGKNT